MGGGDAPVSGAGSRPAARSSPGAPVAIVTEAVRALVGCDAADFETTLATVTTTVEEALAVGADGSGIDPTALRTLFDEAVSAARDRVETDRRFDAHRAGQSLLGEITEAFGQATVDAEHDVVGSAVERLRRHLDCCSVAVFALEDRREFRCLAEATRDGDPLQAPFAPLRKDDPIIARLLDPGSSPSWTFGRLLGVGEDRTNMLILPVLRGRDVVIVSAVRRDVPFARDAASVLRNFVAILGQFRWRLVSQRENRRRSEADRLLGEIAADLVDRTVGDAEEGVRGALDKIAESFGLSTLVVWRGPDLEHLAPWAVHRSAEGASLIVAPGSAVFDAQVRAPLDNDPGRVLSFEPGVHAESPSQRDHSVVFAPIVESGVVIGAVASSEARPLHLVPGLDVLRDLLAAVAQLLRQFWSRLAVDEQISARLATEDRLREFATDLVRGGVKDDGSEALGRLCRYFGIDHASMWRIRRTAEGSVAEVRVQWGIDDDRRVPVDRGAFVMTELEAEIVEQGGDAVQWPFDLDHPLPERWRETTGFEGPRQVALVSEVEGSKLLISRAGEGAIPDEAMSAMATALSILSQHEARSVAEHAFVSAVRSAPIAISVRDVDGHLLSCNDAYAVMVGRSERELIGSTPRLVLAEAIEEPKLEKIRSGVPGDAIQNETAFRRPDGTVVWARSRLSIVEVPGQRQPVYFVYSEDITESRRAQRLLEHQASHDELTGLANRRAFHAAVAAELEEQGDFAVLMLDLDRFKLVNDSLGHSVGDLLLTRCADRIRLSLRPEDLVARLGGDEFAVLLRTPADAAMAAAVSERLLALLTDPVNLHGQEVFPAASIGIAVPGRGATVETLLRDADAAMYEAKRLGGRQAVHFDHSMRQAAESRIRVESELRRGLDDDQFEVFYQPEFALDRGCLVGAEALVRWHHPERGLLTAGEFVEIAEDTGLVNELGRRVLRKATAQAAHWVERGTDLLLRINLSAHQLRWAIVGEVRDALEVCGLAPQRLCLELTETAIMSDPDESARILRELRELGVLVAIDDFGTGFSSLAYLKRFPVDVLKIDRAFVEGLVDDPEDAAIVRSIIGLARTLGLGVVAEGIEESAQVMELLRLGCDRGQGFHLGRPVPASELDLSSADRC